MPRYPKDPRQRQGKGSGAATVTVTAPRLGTRIPDPPASCEWSPATWEWWRAVWSSPVAEALYMDVDAHVLARLGNMYEKALTDDLPAAMHSQMTALEDRLGLSPVSRRRLGVFLTRQEESALDPPQVVALNDVRERYERMAAKAD